MPFDGDSGPRLDGRPLRVALFSGNYNYTLDGANKALNRLVEHLEQVERAQVRVYSPTSPTPAFEPKGELISVPSVSIPTRRDYRLAMGLPATIRRNVEAFQPDIVHLSAPDLLGWSALKLSRRLGIPAVASLHTHFETYLDYYALGWLRPALERRLQAFYASCDLVMVPSQAIADQMSSGVLTGRVRQWARGVDGRLFDPARRDLAWRRAQEFADDDTVVVFFGRLVMEKGLAVFADAVDRIRASHGGARVLVIGDGPARAWLEDRLPHATFTGFLTGPPLGRALASGDIMVNPSRTESFGNVTLEAMASGLAVVGADAPYHHALLRQGLTGVLVQASDPDAYAGAALGLIDDGERRRRIGRAAREASRAFQWSQVLPNVMEVYREALSRTGDRLADHPAPDGLDQALDLIDRGRKRRFPRSGSAMDEQPDT